MKSAKSAGWAFMGWSFCLAVMLTIAHFVKVFVSGVKFLAGAVDVVSAVIWVVLVICLFYAIWGLSCGYNKNAWNVYAKRTDEDIRKGAAACCKNRALTRPPGYLDGRSNTRKLSFSKKAYFPRPLKCPKSPRIYRMYSAVHLAHPHIWVSISREK